MWCRPHVLFHQFNHGRSVLWDFCTFCIPEEFREMPQNCFAILVQAHENSEVTLLPRATLADGHIMFFWHTQSDNGRWLTQGVCMRSRGWNWTALVLVDGHGTQRQGTGYF